MRWDQAENFVNLCALVPAHRSATARRRDFVAIHSG